MSAGAFVSDGADGRRSGADDAQVGVLKAQHKKECRGLVVQIRYLKAKFGRESLFRCDLGYQKQYLLVLLAQFEKRYVGVMTCMQGTLAHSMYSEQRILAAIAQVGFPTAGPASPEPGRRRTLRAVAGAVLFAVRTKSVTVPIASLGACTDEDEQTLERGVEGAVCGQGGDRECAAGRAEAARGGGVKGLARGCVGVGVGYSGR
jgi:hypothetical protein